MKVDKGFEIKVNEFQTRIDEELMRSLPDEVGEQLLDFIDNVPYIQRLISPDRKRAKDLPRDDKGRIVVDLANPHILEDMDYFRPAARFYEENGCYTFLKPNRNPNSAYSKWFHEEKRRCREGYVRPSDGEWVTGYMYFFINYCPMMVTKATGGSRKAGRVEGLPEVWEGIYLRFHYLWQAREAGKHAIELARRGCGKSYTLASIMSHNFLLGENEEVRQKTTTVLVASNKEYLSAKDGTLVKFVPMIDFVEERMDFSKTRIFSSLQNMMWRSGYIDGKGREKGQRNNVMGLSVKDDEDKIRGKRGYLLFEEMGNFPNLLGVYDTARYGVEDGDYTMGIIYLVGTSNNKESNFDSAKKLLYNTGAYNILGVENVYDKKNQGKATFGYFFPAYINRKGCYNKDGVSDVVKALVQILMRRWEEKKGADPRSVLGVIAEQPITPAEAIIKVRDAYFPVAQLSERLRQLDADPKAFDDVYVGQLVINGKGEVEFVATDDVPIRKYGVDNSTIGALEIYEMPEKMKNSDGTALVPYDRYCIGYDPVNNDQADSASLSSAFVIDMFTDRIAAEYTGRQQFADDGFEIVRKLAMFYNAKVLYESNNKGTFAYFKKMNSTFMLADTPQYLRDKQLIKYSSFGSNSKGVNASAALNMYADRLTRDWLLKEITVPDGGGGEVRVPNLYTIRSRALLEELVAYDNIRNFDRVRSLGMAMLYREGVKARLGSNTISQVSDASGHENDDYFARNYDAAFAAVDSIGKYSVS